MTIEIVPYSEDLAPAWDEFCSPAMNATFLHTRRFLAYHGNRFEDVSLIMMEAGSIVGVMPAAFVGENRHVVVSHPGLTYGGVVHQGRLSGTRMIDAIGAVRTYYAAQGCTKLIYKAVPYIYSDMPAQGDLYALFRYGALRTRCDLACTIDLNHRLPMSERRRRGLKKATEVVTLADDPANLQELWTVLEQNLARKHAAQPVHSLVELKSLLNLFPKEIQIRCARINGCVEAGAVFFNSRGAWHAQYIASSERGYQVSALDAVFDSAIREAAEAGVRYFDFGTSNEEGGAVLNDGLYRFKQEFGGGGVAHEFYELDLA
ncbi:GNAT family N-acetyltransferase [Paraburkholderia sp. USG1]|uniref:GNAT family N-acetyltransferase n=1 Tax=Paraburkholderia sp. USG1 TaxID=2952268 RepID=UPI002863690B|nr:GNAT family N-acetyltransferase [Paraburkholderia sp. USG1]MDR8401560.1 GNAT family N-acetyltransferase [Paraburkholderia sp. USG1]